MDLQKNKPLLCFSIVVYREIFYETKAFLSLKECFAKSNETYPIFVYDNTDLEEWNVDYTDMQHGDHIYYHRDKKNSGISIAYNFMAGWASGRGAQWIIFMDQDTTLPLDAVYKYVEAIKRSPQVLVKAPVLLVEGKIFSPFKIFFKRSIKLKKISPGILSLQQYAVVNSGMLVNLNLFFEVGGYNECVKLDFADFLFLERIYTKVKEIEILNFSCTHNFSNNEKNVEKVLARYSIFIRDLNNCPKPTLKDKFGYFLVGLLHATKLTAKFKSLKFYNIWIKGS